MVDAAACLMVVGGVPRMENYGSADKNGKRVSCVVMSETMHDRAGMGGCQRIIIRV